MRGNKPIGIGLMAVAVLALVMMAMVPAVSATTYITTNTPSSNQEVDVGTTVDASIQIYHYGMMGVIGVQIASVATGDVCVNTFVSDGSVATFGCSGTFTMPDETVRLYFRALRWDGSRWIIEDEKIVTLTPTSQQGKFKIRAMDADTHSPISGVAVTVSGISTKTTGSDGTTTWFYADFGTYLDVYITATGYEPFNTGDYFYANEDGMTWTTYLTPEVTQICTPYEIECFGNRELWQCKSDGSEFQFMTDCPYGCEVGSTQCNPAPTQTPTPTPTPTASPTATPTPTPTPDPGMCVPDEKRCFGDYLKTCNSAGDGWDEEKTELCGWGCDAEKKECAQMLPGFEVAFAILGLLTVAYFVRRQRKEE